MGTYKNITRLIITISILTFLGCVTYQTSYGIKDDFSAQAIVRINELSVLRHNLAFEKLVRALQRDASLYAADAYSLARIQNELAEIFTYQYNDLEAAIEIDRKLVAQSIINSPSANGILPKVKAANNNLLGDEEYVNEYIKIDAQQITERAKERLARNLNLLDGKQPFSSSSYTLIELKKHLETVKKDLEHSMSKGSTRFSLISRLIRAEYEITKLTDYSYQAITYFKSGDISLSSFDFSEIDFLRLADYFSQAYRQTHDLRFAELAMETIYQPYIHMRSPAKRWTYNKLINTYISTLVSGNFEAKRYDEMLYYASLNQSRMLLEERLAYSKSISPEEEKIADIANHDAINMLPDKPSFFNQLSSIQGLLDFYVDGTYTRQANTGKHSKSVTDPLSTRDFGAEDAMTTIETYSDDTLYMALVKNGKVVKAAKLTGNALVKAKAELDSSYKAISTNKTTNKVKFIEEFSDELAGVDSPFVITDKWVSKHPIEYHLGGNYVRTVNLFTYAHPKSLERLDVTGFFNPTLDLSGSDQEAASIAKYFPQSKLFTREHATKTNITTALTANVLHLSMHGAYNPENPRYSKLYLHGALRGLSLNDPNALYANEMGNYALLKDRDLIFAAACQTGLISSDSTNQSELVGILRPLTANRNHSVILSLWKVDDAATRHFVDVFYQSLSTTKRVQEAFQAAKTSTMNQYSSPYYWSAFYLSVIN